MISPTVQRLAALACLAVGICGATAPASAQRSIVVASTTSTHNSDLFDDMLPKFKQASGIDVRVLALGTGQALRTGQNGGADALFVHDAEAELKFVADGHGIDRREVMYNDFVIVGPGADPAKVRGLKDALAALHRISSGFAPFISRGDDSGTHLMELRLWLAAGIDVRGISTAWYRSTGAGMGAVLNTAAAFDGYALTDRGTWLSLANRQSLAVLVEGDPRLFNQYSIILVNPARHPRVKIAEARAFADWLVSPAGQAAIADFSIAGQQAFFPERQQDDQLIWASGDCGHAARPRNLLSRPGDDPPATAPTPRSRLPCDLMKRGDLDGKRVWLQIVRAIEELQRVSPSEGDEVH